MHAGGDDRSPLWGFLVLLLNVLVQVQFIKCSGNLYNQQSLPRTCTVASPGKLSPAVISARDTGNIGTIHSLPNYCLLYTSDAADE